MPVKHMFSCTKVWRNKLHSFSKISADVFSLLYFKSLHSQSLNCLIEEVLLGWRGCKLFWIHGSWVQEILVFVPWPVPWASCHLMYLSPLLPCASTEQVICARVVWSRFLEAVSTSAKKFLEQSYAHLCSVRRWCMWSCWNSLHVVHSVECLHVVRSVESQICTHRFRVHLERVHPLMNLCNYFRCRGTFAWIGFQM